MTAKTTATMTDKQRRAIEAMEAARTLVNKPFQRLSFRVNRGDEVLVQGDITPEQLEQMRAAAGAAGDAWYQTVTAFCVLGNLEFAGPCKLHLERSETTLSCTTGHARRHVRKYRA